jgi:carbon storage regulator CsrA
MLVLKRRVGEEIIITVGQETIVVKLVYIHGPANIGIGVKASPDVRIDRKEIHDSIMETGFNPEAYPIKPPAPVSLTAPDAVRLWQKTPVRRDV